MNCPTAPCIKVVGSFEELITTQFADGVNALCWPRTLVGNFAEVVEHLQQTDSISTLNETSLRSLELSPEGQQAVDWLIADLRLLNAQGLDPLLDCIQAYPREENPGAVRIDVYSFHADSAPVEASTFLCTYFGPSSEGLRPDEAMRHVDVPETRAALLAEFGGEDDADFVEYLNENCYDLHYKRLSGAVPYAFGLGNLWRIAIQHPGCPVPPCVHRAPENEPGKPPRLLLIS